MRKLLLILTALILFLAPFTYAGDPVATCKSMAGLMRLTAEARDSGLPESEAIKAIEEEKRLPVEAKDLIISGIHSVYQNPSVPPFRVEELFNKACLQVAEKKKG